MADLDSFASGDSPALADELLELVLMGKENRDLPAEVKYSRFAAGRRPMQSRRCISLAFGLAGATTAANPTPLYWLLLKP